MSVCYNTSSNFTGFSSHLSSSFVKQFVKLNAISKTEHIGVVIVLDLHLRDTCFEYQPGY